MKRTKLTNLIDKPALQEIAHKAIPILKEAGVKHASIFGSFVRGDNKKGSDVDFLIDTPRGMSLFEFAGLQIKLAKALRKKVDMGDYSALKPRIKHQVLNEQVRIL
jgi:uncharacterized protein